LTLTTAARWCRPFREHTRSEGPMRSIQIPKLAPLKTCEVLRSDDTSDVRFVVPVPEDLLFFRVPGVKDEDVATVLAALIERRFVERARKISKGGDSIAPPSSVRVVIAGLGGLIVGGLIGFLVASLWHPASGADGAPAGAVAGVIFGLFYGLWQRAKAATAFTGLKLLYGEPGGSAEERLHPNYWLPHAIRSLCSPKPGIMLDA
jgi:hypothetical protein